MLVNFPVSSDSIHTYMRIAKIKNWRARSRELEIRFNVSFFAEAPYNPNVHSGNQTL